LHHSRRPRYRSACSGARAPQDDALNPHGEEHGNAVRLPDDASHRRENHEATIGDHNRNMLKN
jgi:hypothetical protein